MSNANRKMKRANAAKANKEQGVNEEVVWDDLVGLYESSNASLKIAIDALKEVGESFKDVLDADKDLGNSYVGSANSLADLTGELTKIASTHSVKDRSEDNKTVSFKPYTGAVDLNSEPQQKVYTYCVMAYAGMNDKITSVVDTVINTLLGNIKVVAERLNIAIDERMGELKEEGSKDEETEPAK